MNSNNENIANIISFVIDFIALTAIFFALWFVIDVGVDYVRDWHQGVKTLDGEKVLDYLLKDLMIGSLISLATTSINHFYYKQSFISKRIK